MPLVFPGAKPKPIGDVSFARRDGRLVFRAHVKDPTPLVNAATEANAVFKGGDAVGFEIGPATTPATIPERRPDPDARSASRACLPRAWTARTA
jgi:hypothetical protein